MVTSWTVKPSSKREICVIKEHPGTNSALSWLSNPFPSDPDSWPGCLRNFIWSLHLAYIRPYLEIILSKAFKQPCTEHWHGRKGPCAWHTKPLWVPTIPYRSPACWVLLLERNTRSSDTDLDKCCVIKKTEENNKQSTFLSALSACWISAGCSNRPDPISRGTLETTGWPSRGSLGSRELQEQIVPFLRTSNPANST